MTMQRKRFIFFLKLSVSVLGLLLVFYKIPLEEIGNNWNRTTLSWLLLLIFFTFLSMIIQANRWKGLLLEEGKKIRFRTFYAYIAIGYFFTAFLPGGFGGDVIKTLAFGKRFRQTSNSVAAILISRIQGLLMLFLLFFIFLPWVCSHYSVSTSYILGMLVALLLTVAILAFCCFSDKIRPLKFISNRLTFVSKLQNSLVVYRNHKKQFFLSLLDSLWLQLLVFATSYGYLKSVGISLDFRLVIVFSAITIIITMLPISLNGIGVREWISISLYSGIAGLPAEKVLAGHLLGYVLILFQAIQGAIVLASQKRTS